MIRFPRPTHTSYTSDEKEAILIVSITIGDGRSGIITVKEDDNASSLSQAFCDTHSLPFKVKRALQNYLASQIQRALQLSGCSTPEEEIPLKVSRYHPSPVQIPTVSRSRSRISRKIPAYQRLYNLSRSNSPPKEVKSTSNKSIKIKESQRLYYQGLRDKELVKRRNQAYREQRKQEQMKSFTFKPQTNSKQQPRGVAPELMLLRKWVQRNQKLEAKRSSLLQQQMEPCTFSPNIDKKSKKIERKKKTKSPDRFVDLYDGAKRREKNISEKSQKLQQAQCPFVPDTRLTNSMNKSVLERKESYYYYRSMPELTEESVEELFRPKIGRPPRRRDCSPKDIGDHLYSISMRSFSQQRLPEAPVKMSAEKSDLILRKLKLRKYGELFESLCPYQGIISKETIQKCRLPAQIYTTIYPLLEELVDLDEKLSFEEFCESMEMLMKILSPAEKNLLLGVKKQASPVPKYSFKPAVNKRRRFQGSVGSEPVYQRNLKKKKQVSRKVDGKRIAKAAAELEECTFQPTINHYKTKHIESLSSYY